MSSSNADIGRYFKALDLVENVYDADLYLYSGAIENRNFGRLVTAITETKPNSARKNGLLILTTTGGLANNAYQIARLFQQTYERFIIFLPSYCKSAGTLVALGAHQIIMDVFSELGPLDVQLLEKEEIGARKSGLLTRSTFQALSEETFELFSNNMMSIKGASSNQISFKLAADIAVRLTTELLSPIFSQMNPDTIGSDYRNLSVASEYGDRLAATSRNLKPDTVDRLVKGYPSHDFIIDRSEASSLFNSVKEPSDELYQLMEFLRVFTYQQASPPVVAPCRTIFGPLDAAQENTVPATENEDNNEHS